MSPVNSEGWYLFNCDDMMFWLFWLIDEVRRVGTGEIWYKSSDKLDRDHQKLTSYRVRINQIISDKDI